MQNHNLISKLQQLQFDEQNKPIPLDFNGNASFEVYPNSVFLKNADCFFIAKMADRKYLYYIDSENKNSCGFAGDQISLAEKGYAWRCPLNHRNAEIIRSLFDFTRPVLVGLADSFGFGDRLGIANPAHVRSLAHSKMKPILAQQSIRELQRTQREADEVMDAATWAVLQEGFTDGFGADADHLKTPEDIDRMVKAGFTFFTIDPSAYVLNEADTLPISDLEARCKKLPWDVLKDNYTDFIATYLNKSITISHDFIIQPDKEQIVRGLAKYGGVIAHTAKLYWYLKETHPQHPAEFELSVDETDSVTSPFEHYLVVNELKRLGVKLISLAPRFVGDFEKGIDFKGDINLFKETYTKHIKIADKLGPYKISIHSGSDKFTVYEAIGALNLGHVHVKTAGTSYLEALKTVATKQPDLFREILDFSRKQYEVEKATYHVSAKLAKVPAANQLTDEQLPTLFEQNDARQVMHVAFGKVLTTKADNGSFLFKDRILSCLNENEETHYDYLIKHFKRHLKSFNK